MVQRAAYAAVADSFCVRPAMAAVDAALDALSRELLTPAYLSAGTLRLRAKGVDGREPELTLGGPSLVPSRKCLLEAKLASVEMLL